MKKEITLRRSFMEQAREWGMSKVTPLAELLSWVIEEEITPLQALLILQAVCSFTLLIFSVCVPLVLRLLMLVWFVYSIWQCKRAGLK